jgi:hypothetical protein
MYLTSFWGTPSGYNCIAHSNAWSLCAVISQTFRTPRQLGTAAFERRSFKLRTDPDIYPGKLWCSIQLRQIPLWRLVKWREYKSKIPKSYMPMWEVSAKWGTFQECNHFVLPTNWYAFCNGPKAKIVGVVEKNSISDQFSSVYYWRMTAGSVT